MKILLPKTLGQIESSYGPLFFLAGPGRGGGDWQSKCCSEIRKLIPNFHAALPCRYPNDHPIMEYEIKGQNDIFERQNAWERYYLELAANGGCIIFWLPCESKADPRTNGEPYSMETFGELGEWRGRLMHNSNLRIVIGAEPGFIGLSPIQYNFDCATRSKFPIYKTLEETVAAAVKKVS